MAMIIRCFSIEVYKIPTGSMEPTLHGDYENGDRVIADKFTLLFMPIKRFDVLLFRFPLDKSTNFIKRIVGLPNEELMIKRGDLYSRPKGTDKFVIAKKPLKTQESIWIPFYNKWNGSEEQLTETWELSEEKYYPSGSEHKIQNGKLYLQGDNLIRYKYSIRDKYDWSSGKHEVSDIKFSFRVRAEQNGGEIGSTIKTPCGNFTLRLYPQQIQPINSQSSMASNNVLPPCSNVLEHYIASGNSIKSLPIDMKVEPGKDYFVEILNFDGSIYVKINKKLIQQYDYITFLEENDRPDKDYSFNQVSLEVKKNSVELWDFKIDRDIYYASDYDSRSILKENEPLVIPDGKYVAIGDNIPNSKDSRIWRMRTITLKNGKVIKCDAEPSSDSYQDSGRMIRVLRDKRTNRGGDIWGMSHVTNKDDVVSNDVEPYPFVSSNEIFGRALLIYWPLPRLKFIR
jgi:signal peptidase I